jgi:hypothetical protein
VDRADEADGWITYRSWLVVSTLETCLGETFAMRLSSLARMCTVWRRTVEALVSWFWCFLAAVLLPSWMWNGRSTATLVCGKCVDEYALVDVDISRNLRDINEMSYCVVTWPTNTGETVPDL